MNNYLTNKIKWGDRSQYEIDTYYKIYCNEKRKSIDFPCEFQRCCKGVCRNNCKHRCIIDSLYERLVSILSEAASVSYEAKCSTVKSSKGLRGWNRYVSDAHREARSKFLLWVWYGKPKCGFFYEDMVASRKVFKGKLKWCQNHQEQLKMDALALHHGKGDFKIFWKSTNRLNSGPGLPADIEGVSEPKAIANLSREHFAVRSLSCSVGGMPDAETDLKCVENIISAKNVAKTIKSMTRGKSPGHDSLSIEHLQNAGPHLHRVLAMLFNIRLVSTFLLAAKPH